MMTWLQFRTKVKEHLTDVTPSDAIFAQAVADWTKAKIEREVMRSLPMHDSYFSSYKGLKRKLIGYEFSGDDAALKAEVTKHLPVDATRLNTEVFIDTCREMAKQDLEGYATILENWIRCAVIDVQRVVMAMQMGHENEYTLDDVVQEGNASQGQLPEEALPHQAWIVYVKPDDDCPRREILELTPWADRYLQLINATTCVPRLTFEPMTKAFYVTPQLEETDDVNITLRVTWNGLKLEFADGDGTPFPEEMAKVVADYVESEASLYFADGAQTRAQYLQNYRRGRALLYADSLEERRLNLRG